ncbi:hypothetical protein DDP54_09980 [Cellulomonas sp. WB94]|uniref:hypothetical protein n=1 Tax=Cellulomonas sp. WB94 TaxID=2173174 RepID=UPI000D5761E8|nr:hypothetical protein [Cellulomonas sp. WB94]PVU83266.1 hypothetical protein DDP54_09980 [Cellulomonas sp. WB94]
MTSTLSVRTAVVMSVSALLIALGGCSTSGSPDVASTGATPATIAPSSDAAPAAPPGAAATVAPSTCNAPPPPGASEAALAYLAAVDAATPAWQALSTTLTHQGQVTHRDDLLTQVNADAPFLTALREIDFPPDAAPYADKLVLAIQAYDDFLTTAYDTEGYLASHPDDDSRLNETRAQSSSRLRDVLGVQPSNCTFNRP